MSEMNSDGLGYGREQQSGLRSFQLGGTVIPPSVVILGLDPRTLTYHTLRKYRALGSSPRVAVGGCGRCGLP